MSDLLILFWISVPIATIGLGVVYAIESAVKGTKWQRSRIGILLIMWHTLMVVDMIFEQKCTNLLNIGTLLVTPFYIMEAEVVTPCGLIWFILSQLVSLARLIMALAVFMERPGLTELDVAIIIMQLILVILARALIIRHPGHRVLPHYCLIYLIIVGPWQPDMVIYHIVGLVGLVIVDLLDAKRNGWTGVSFGLE